MTIDTYDGLVEDKHGALHDSKPQRDEERSFSSKIEIGASPFLLTITDNADTLTPSTSPSLDANSASETRTS